MIKDKSSSADEWGSWGGGGQQNHIVSTAQLTMPTDWHSRNTGFKLQGYFQFQILDQASMASMLNYIEVFFVFFST